MPELPEVEISRRGIEPHFVREVISHVVVRHPILRCPVSKEIYTIKNQMVLSVQRRAKYLLLELQKGWIVIHLGMSGSLRVLLEITAASKHDHIDLIMKNGKVLRYTDPRRFGAWLWRKDLRMLDHFGLDPLSEQFNTDYLFKKSRSKCTVIKSWLMNNKLVVGIGNIYANESLFLAKILPDRRVMTLNYEEVSLLVSSIKDVLLRSIEQGGTTLRDFLQSDGKPGYFIQELQVYGRDGKPCIVCSIPIERTKHGQRSTFFCRNCQK